MQHITDLWQHIQHLVITQYRDSTNLLSLLRKVFSSFQDLEDSAFRLSNFANIDEAEGEWLDLIGKFRNIPRQPGETDEMYKARLKISFKKIHSRRTPQGRRTTSSKTPATFRATRTRISLTNVPPSFSSIRREAGSFDAAYFKCWRLLAFSRSLLRD